jgi:hypothetical protein
MVEVPIQAVTSARPRMAVPVSTVSDRRRVGMAKPVFFVVFVI